MSDETDSQYEHVQAEYRRLINDYGEALTARNPVATDLFARATAAWERLREFKHDEGLAPDAHWVLAFSFAIQARDEVEAKRLYDAMSDDYRNTVDGVEGMQPGSMKIWLPK